MLHIENVPGFQKQFDGKIFKHFIEELEMSGYVIKHKVLNAKMFGIPQNRERLFIVGTKNKNFKFPYETHLNLEDSLFANYEKNSFLFMKQYVIYQK